MSEDTKEKDVTNGSSQKSFAPVVPGGVPDVASASVGALPASATVDSYVEISRVLKDLTVQNTKSILVKLDNLSCESQIIAREIHQISLSQLFTYFLKDVRAGKDSGNSNSKEARRKLFQALIDEVTGSYYLVSTICSSLQIGLRNTKEEGDSILTLLLQYILYGDIEEEKNSCKPSVQPHITVALTVAICTGWIPSENQKALNFAAERLLHSLEHLPNLSRIKDPLLQSIIFTLTSSRIFIDNPELKKKGKDLATNLIKMSSGEGESSNIGTYLGMAERLSLSRSDIGIGVTNLLAELGPACTQNVSTLRDTLKELTRSLPCANGGSVSNQLEEKAIARLLHFFSERGTRKNTNESDDSPALVGTLIKNKYDIGGNTEWNLNIVSEIISEDFSELNWVKVAQNFDFAGFHVQDSSHLSALLLLYKAGSNSSFPASIVVSIWQNESGQLSFLENLLSVPPNIFSFPVNDAEAADAATVADGTSSNCANPEGWASTGTLQRLLQLSDVQSLSRRVRDLFVRGLLSCPEILLCALVRLQLSVAQQGQGIGSNANAGMQMKGELMRELIPLFFKPNPHHRVQNGPAALRRLWSISPNTVAAACIEAWRSTSNDSPQVRLATIVHVISIIRLLPSPENATATILNGNKDFEFSIAVAFIMADNEMLQLRPWLIERATGSNVLFFVALVAYIGKTYAIALPRVTSSNYNDGKVASLLSIENLVLSIQFLQGQENSLLAQEIPSPSTPNDASSTVKMTVGDSIKAVVEACASAHNAIRSCLSGSSNANNPTLSSVFSGSSTANNPTPSTTNPPSQNSDDIEEMANSYFQKIYTSEQSIGEVVDMLKRFKSSGNVRENDIFACMIHNLFDEYRFFSKYPEKELRITGILFGMLIQHQLVSSITLGIALRYVLEALRKPPSPGTTTSNSGKMFRFGMFALEQFKERLHEWPQYCSHIVQIPHLKQGYADLVNEIEGAMSDNSNRNSSGPLVNVPVIESNSVASDRSENMAVNGQTSLASGVPSSVDIRVTTPASGSNGDSEKQIIVNAIGPSEISVTPGVVPVPAKQVHSRKAIAVFGPGLGRAVNEQKEGAETQHDAPPDAILDRVQFLINNVTMSNVDKKALDLRDMLAPQYFGWLGHYLVVKRISTQPNFHSVYLAFLDQLGDYGRGLIEAILYSVYLNVGKLLRSPKITTSTSERSLLKNLGSWLGQITLARNRPILQITLDCKELLFQGYETGMLIAVTPFVAKILEGAKKSIVFMAPNPWLMGLLSVFRALYGVDDLKMNIKFEVEVLCKNLGVKLEDIPLRTEDLAKRLPPHKTRNPDFNIKSSMQPPTSTAASTSTGNTQGSARSTTPSKLSSSDDKQGAAGLPPATASGMALVAANPSSGPFVSVVSPSSTDANTQDQQQTVIPNLAAYVTINPSLGSGTVTGAILKRTVPVAVDRAIREIIQPVVERSVTIACITTREIVTKDFAMESDENKMRKAAQLMVANLAGSLALVTCREPLRASVSTHLRQLLLSNGEGSGSSASNASSNSQLSEQDRSAIEKCVGICSDDNLELGCMLIEKAATEKAVRDMDEALGPALTTRKKHREQTGQPFYDMSIFGTGTQRYPSALPEALRPKPVGLRNEQLLVYEAFQRMPRQPSVPTSDPQNTLPTNPAASEDTLSGNNGSKINVEALSTIAGKLDNAVTTLLTATGPRAREVTLAMLPPDHDIKQLLATAQQCTSSAASAGHLSSSETDAILGFAQSIFKRLYELRLSEPLRLEAFVAMLEALNECCVQLGQDLGTWATYAPTETDGQRKLHCTVLLLLLRSRLIEISELDEYLSRSMEGGRNIVWLDFTVVFLRTALLEKIVNQKGLPKVMTVVTRVADGSDPNSDIVRLQNLFEKMSRESGGEIDVKGRTDPNIVTDLDKLVGKPDKPTHRQSSSISASSLTNLAEATKRASEAIDAIANEDPINLRKQVMVLLESWMLINNDGIGMDKALQFIQLLQQNGVGKNEEQTERFFRVSTEILVEAVIKSSPGDSVETKCADDARGKALNYNVIDSYAKLIALVIRHMNSGGANEQVANERISLLNKILGITVRTMMAHYERSKGDGLVIQNWDQRPWFRLLLNLVLDLNSPNPVLDQISYGILSVFGSAFHVIQPLVVPGFAFAWLELVSHRMFLSNLLSVKGQKGWALAHQLLIDLFLFLEPHLRRTELTEAMKHLYRGILRVLLVLLHDFPAFLAGYHLSFCNVIPENCVQLRNLILSAFPRGMVLPDPFTPNLKIDLLPEISKSPTVLSNVSGPLSSIREDLDIHLKSNQLSDFLHGLLPRLCRNGTKEIDAPRINALVLYVGIQAIDRLQNNQISHALGQTPEIEIMQKLMDFNDSGRYVSLNAIANQLRYPSSHTHYYSCVMLYLFSEAKDEGVREQITRVLLERLIVHRPHPWGLLITFIELIKNQRYQFWSHPFTRCATEIEKVFESVARSCMTPGSQHTGNVGGGEISQ